MKNFFRRSKKDSLAVWREALKDHDPPRFGQGVTALLSELRNPDASQTRIVRQLESHPALVVDVLRSVNSAGFGLGRSVDSLDHAIALLGRSALELLVLGQSARRALPNPKAAGFDLRRFWTSSFARAGLARALSNRLHPSEGPLCFIAGLLQDMAIPLAVEAQPDSYSKVLEAWHAAPELDLADIEREMLGWTHGDLGAHLGVVWDLPESLVNAIAFHHNPLDFDPEGGLLAVQLVSAYRETRREHGIEGLVHEARDRFGLDPDWTLATIEAVQGEAEQMASEALRQAG